MKRQRTAESGLCLLLLVFLLPGAACHAAESGSDTVSDLELLRNRFVKELLEPDVNSDHIRELLETVEPAGFWPDINYEDTSRTAFEHSRHLSNMLALGRAYRKKESPYYKEPEVKKAVHSTLDFWLKHDFICENWWWNQIGTPERIGDLLLIMDDELTAEQQAKAAPIVGRANLDAWGARPGGDLIKIAGILGKYGIFAGDRNILEQAITAIAGEIEFAVERGDSTDMRGLQTDYSFHHRHDRVTSTLTYGHGFARYFVDWAYKARGTSFSFPAESIEMLVDFYLDGIIKTMAFVTYPDLGAKNRGITRRGSLSAYSADVPEKLLRITSYRNRELAAIAGIRRGEQDPALESSRFFWHTEYYSHQRPDYFASVRMYSSRNHNMEVPYNGEGLKNHHLGDGYTFITRTGQEYRGIFPVWDWQKIPGTTVIQKPALPAPDQVQQAGVTEFVGGVTDGMYGAATFDFRSPVDPLEARKSWFFFDEEFVSLGAGINASSEHPVATTLNQSLLAGEVISGGPEGRESHVRGTHHLKEIRWVHHDKTAYIFPEPTTARLENRRQRGEWDAINNQFWAKTLEEVQKDVFTLWIDHGVAPRQARYEYIVVPGIAATEVQRYRESSPIHILANSPRIQAVHHRRLNISQIVFYEPGRVEIAEGINLSVDNPALVMVERTGGKVAKITVSDPTRRLTTYQLQISSGAEPGPVDAKQVRWNEDEGTATVTLNLPQGEYAGQSVSVDLL
ncbi:polysaccharide lyase family 8 super-sandwich domain-containing protein [Fodinibius sediminis]|uniref:Chondroitin AC lyase n=1 Tax=Fodinibius sediminis TaxID=1214077 RepID=A0A521DNQ0_9BACT|nr:polysaccharide lyase family 8 super-sandwich domain-containing protein [Fodinibius sediminis]SMO73313.1 chondroitin AC lyase [Fodinibius sediminis]